MSTYSRTLSKVQSLALIIAPLLTIISSLNLINGIPSPMSAVFKQLAAIGWVIIFIGLFGKLRDHSPRYAVFGLIVAIIGCFGASAFAQMSLYLNAFGLNLDHAREVMQSRPAFMISLMIPSLLFPLSVLVLAIMLGKHKRVDTWVWACMAVAAIAFPASRMSATTTFALAADVLMLAPLAYLGMRGLRHSSNEVTFVTT